MVLLVVSEVPDDGTGVELATNPAGRAGGEVNVPLMVWMTGVVEELPETASVPPLQGELR